MSVDERLSEPESPPASAAPCDEAAAARSWQIRSRQLLEEHLQRVRGQDLHVFAYGSLIWRPDFDYEARTLARVQGYHRALRMRSRVYRGTPELPGLVLALLSGGSCTGLLYRIDARRAEAVLRQVWEREMVTGAYQPRWLRCHPCHHGRHSPSRPTLSALGFTLSRHSPNCADMLDDAAMLSVLRHARGRAGSSMEYLERTVLSLRQHGLRDRELERLYALALKNGLGTALR